MTTQVGCQFAMSMENHSLKYLIVAGEKILSFDPPKNYQLVNGYGPTETTITNTNYHVKEHLNNVPIGSAHDNMRMYIVDKLGQRAPIGCQGELWACGPQVGKGYLHLPEKTAEAFIKNPFDTTYPYDRAYRTGDTTCWRSDGNILYMGRKDGQVKIRGFRIELKEVEGIIRQYPGIKDVTVQAFDADGGGKFIAAYIVSNEQVDIQALGDFIKEEKPPYMVPAVTMQIEKIPLNVNQKVDKKALPKPELQVSNTSAEVVSAPLNILEQEIKELISDIIKVEEYSITEPLVYLGLTSISCIRLATLVFKKYNVKLDTKQFAKTGTLQEIENAILAQMLTHDSAANDASQSKETEGKMLRSTLTYPQQGVYFDIMKNPTGTTYNIPLCLDFPVGTEVATLEAAVNQLLQSHPILFEHFETEGDEIVQVIPEHPQSEVEVVKATTEEYAEIKSHWAKPFDLKNGPLYHAMIVDDGRLHLLLDFLHLAMDGASVNLFTTQLMQLLNGEQVESEKYNYLVYAAEEKSQENSPQYQEAKEFFDSRLKSVDGISSIQEDVKALDDAQKHLLAASELVDMSSIKKFAANLGITPAAIFLAAAHYTVSRYTNNADTAMCTISNGRSNVKFSDTVGMMVNTLAITSHIKDVTVKDYILATAEEFDATLRHENYPFAKVSAAFGVQPDTFFQYQIGVMPQLQLKGEKVDMRIFGDKTPKFKFTISIEANPERIEIQYDDTCYSQQLAAGFASAMKAVLTHFIEQPEARLLHVSMLNEAQAQQIISFHETKRAEIPVKLYHKLFEKSAAEHAQETALVALNPVSGLYSSYTYEELNNAMNRMAHSLIQMGVKRGDRVAILLPRTSRLIMSQYAIMKAGAAYIPCDPKYPTERINLILEDSEARFILTTSDRLEEFPGRAIDVETLLKDSNVADNPQVEVSPDDLCYLIYTSGSTGRPKGVQLMHKGVTNYHCEKNLIQSCLKDECHAALGITTISFDMSVWETGSPLMLGKKLVFVGDNDCNDPNALAQLIAENQVDCMTATTSRFMQLLESEKFEKVFREHIHLAYQGGEALSTALLLKLQSYPNVRIFNGYGPTETIANSHASELTTGSIAHIGKPCVNYTNYIVDNDGNELPIGVVGELAIGGLSVAKGYNNLPEQTADKFRMTELNAKQSPVYFTGDYARWLSDGNVMLLGRKDNQVKLRGLRIELGEVEGAITKAGDLLGGENCIKNVVVMIRKINGKDHLCAYFTANQSINIDDLKQEISKTLTLYMVPTAYLQMEEFPLTPNGKTDVKHLPEPELVQVGGEYVAPANETEKQFCDIFARILSLDKVGATDDFFEMGGTSLVVTRVLIEADKLGYSLAYGDVFNHTTPRMLSQLLGFSSEDKTENKASSELNVEDGYDYTAINKQLLLNNLDSFRNQESINYKNILVTGATGYLGIHILQQLINSNAEHIYCLIRGNNNASAEQRLKQLLFYYFDNSYEQLFGKRIFIIRGDVTQDILPLDERLKEVEVVFNCAALVKHFGEGTEIIDVNVGSVQKCIDFCQQTKALLVHISTNSTSGVTVEEKPLPTYKENVLFEHQNFTIQYTYAKFIGERIILDAVSKGSINAKIMRVGNLSARAKDGEFQANFSANSFMGRLRVYQTLGAFPYDMYDKAVEFSPIDQVAEAILLLSHTPKECTVFHPYNNHKILLGDVVSELNSIGYDVQQVEQDDFEKILKEAGTDEMKAKRLVSLMAYMGKAGNQSFVNVESDNKYTMSILHRMGFKWSQTTFDYIRQFLNAINGLGYFDI